MERWCRGAGDERARKGRMKRGGERERGEEKEKERES